MFLRTIRVAGWRNLAPVDLTLGPGVTVFSGHNAQGKTNLIEAAYYLAEFRSFRTKQATDLVAWGHEAARIDALVDAGGLTRKIEITVAAGRKTVLVDGKSARRDSPNLRGVAVVLFVPEDLLLPRAAPATRRSFLDRASFSVDRGFYAEAVAYQRVLRNRNALLKSGAVKTVLLDTYDEQLARAGARLIVRRRTLVQALGPRVNRLFAAIHAPLPVALNYSGHAGVEDATTEGEIELALAEGLAARRTLDERRRFTGFGPHTDDLEILLEGRPVREHGSQGQMRSLVLALKLAELDHVGAMTGEPPLLLLDDVASELDEIRRGKLFETISGLTGQTLITVTDRAFLPALPGRCDYLVSAGQVAVTPGM